MPNLDDRRWSDLVEEGQALIPLYAPEWTDYNASDPGITLVELFAWLAEMDVFQLNQVPERHRRKFLGLLGIQPEPPHAARTVVRFSPNPKVAAIQFPAGYVVESVDTAGQHVLFRTLDAVTAEPVELETLQWSDGRAFHDLTRSWLQGIPFGAFGDNPMPGTAFYLGLNQPLPATDTVSFYFTFANPGAGQQERMRLIKEASNAAQCCGAPVSLVSCGQKSPPASPEPSQVIPPHHSARTAWEFFVGAGGWHMLNATAGEIHDDTRSFTLDGPVLVKLPADMAPCRLGRDETPRYYLRCRFAAGAYDDAPLLATAAVNAVAVEQAIPPDLPVALGLTPSAPHMWDQDREQLGTGTGAPGQQVSTYAHPVIQSSFELHTILNGLDEQWTRRDDFDASEGTDHHFLLDPTTGTVTFGDGEKGRVAPPGAIIAAKYLTTLAEAGNVAAGTITTTGNQSVTVTNLLPATGGTAAETLPDAEERAVTLVNAPTRAVTLGDYETLAMATPGVRLARVVAQANLHPSFPCVKAPGMIAVCVLPFLPTQEPQPSAGLLQSVRRHLRRQRVLGTRVEVLGPTYVEVTVQAKVRAKSGVNTTSLSQRIISALNNYFDPLKGGPEQGGWPFGRAVYRSDVLAVIDETDGVDNVVSLELVRENGTPQYSNVCLGPMDLVASGQHQIELVS